MTMSRIVEPCPLIRRLHAKDAPNLGALFERNNREEVTRFFHPFPLTQDSASHVLEKARRDLFFGMEHRKHLVAFGMLRGWDEGFDVPRFGILVDADHQGKGFGRRLTEWSLRWADQIKCRKVQLTVYGENAKAYCLYHHLGFRVTEEGASMHGLTPLAMERQLPPSSMPIYVSTQCLRPDEALEDRLTKLYEAGFHHVELSSYPVGDKMRFLRWAESFPGRVMLHHFFPPEPSTLVLNLASKDPRIRSESLSFFKRGLEWSAALGSNHYSIHGGYAVDPIGRDGHGFVFPIADSTQRGQSIDRYVEGLLDLCGHAKQLGVKLLVENNVMAELNRGKLLLSTPSEFARLIEICPSGLPIGILLDWGHWQVTARTLDLRPDGFAGLQKYVVGLHLHSNNLREDEHLAFAPDTETVEMLRALKPAFVTLEGRYAGFGELQAAIIEVERTIYEQ